MADKHDEALLRKGAGLFSKAKRGAKGPPGSPDTAAAAGPALRKPKPAPCSEVNRAMARPNAVFKVAEAPNPYASGSGLVGQASRAGMQISYGQGAPQMQHGQYQSTQSPGDPSASGQGGYDGAAVQPGIPGRMPSVNFNAMGLGSGSDMQSKIQMLMQYGAPLLSALPGLIKQWQEGQKGQQPAQQGQQPAQPAAPKQEALSAKPAVLDNPFGAAQTNAGGVVQPKWKAPANPAANVNPLANRPTSVKQQNNQSVVPRPPAMPPKPAATTPAPTAPAVKAPAPAAPAGNTTGGAKGAKGGKCGPGCNKKASQLLKSAAGLYGIEPPPKPMPQQPGGFNAQVGGPRYSNTTFVPGVASKATGGIEPPPKPISFDRDLLHGDAGLGGPSARTGIQPGMFTPPPKPSMPAAAPKPAAPATPATGGWQMKASALLKAAAGMMMPKPPMPMGKQQNQFHPGMLDDLSITHPGQASQMSMAPPPMGYQPTKPPMPQPYKPNAPTPPGGRMNMANPANPQLSQAALDPTTRWGKQGPAPTVPVSGVFGGGPKPSPGEVGFGSEYASQAKQLPGQIADWTQKNVTQPIAGKTSDIYQSGKNMLFGSEQQNPDYAEWNAHQSVEADQPKWQARNNPTPTSNNPARALQPQPQQNQVTAAPTTYRPPADTSSPFPSDYLGSRIGQSYVDQHQDAQSQQGTNNAIAKMGPTPEYDRGYGSNPGSGVPGMPSGNPEIPGTDIPSANPAELASLKGNPGAGLEKDFPPDLSLLTGSGDSLMAKTPPPSSTTSQSALGTKQLADAGQGLAGQAMFNRDLQRGTHPQPPQSESQSRSAETGGQEGPQLNGSPNPGSQNQPYAEGPKQPDSRFWQQHGQFKDQGLGVTGDKVRGYGGKTDHTIKRGPGANESYYKRIEGEGNRLLSGIQAKQDNGEELSPTEQNYMQRRQNFSSGGDTNEFNNDRSRGGNLASRQFGREHLRAAQHDRPQYEQAYAAAKEDWAPKAPVPDYNPRYGMQGGQLGLTHGIGGESTLSGGSWPGQHVPTS